MSVCSRELHSHSSLSSSSSPYLSAKTCYMHGRCSDCLGACLLLRVLTVDTDARPCAEDEDDSYVLSHGSASVSALQAFQHLMSLKVTEELYVLGGAEALATSLPCPPGYLHSTHTVSCTAVKFAGPAVLEAGL